MNAQTVFTMQALFFHPRKRKEPGYKAISPLLLPLLFPSIFFLLGFTATISLIHLQLRPRLLLFGCQSAVVLLSLVRNWSGDHDRIISLSKEG